MRNFLAVFSVFLLLFLFIGVPSSKQAAQSEAAAKMPNASAQVLAQRNLPLEFIPNAGQMDGRVSFVIKGSDRILYFTPEGMTMALYKETKALKPERGKAPAGPRYKESDPKESWVVKMDFIGTRKNVVPEGLEKTGAVFSYFKGSREDWHTGLPGYGRIIYRDLWPGIDLVYKGDVGRLKYEFIVGAGVDPGQIQLGIRGANSVAVDKDGRLVVDTSLEKIIDERPLAFQESKTGARTPVKAEYRIDRAASENHQVGFSLEDYDRSLALIIDPATLVYCGYIGGSEIEYGYGIAIDGSGNAYITGYTFSSEHSFPVGVGPVTTYSGGGDAFVAKVNASGTGLVYCGYIGGADYDYGTGIAVDGSGNAYITGTTYSFETTFPATVGPVTTYSGRGDTFVAKVNASGTGLVYCGYIGGFDDDYGTGIAVDGSGNAYITGNTYSNEHSFPVTVGPATTYGGSEDAFVAKVSTSGTELAYCGYIGGFDRDEGRGVALDSLGNAYIAGYTLSDEATFPVTVGPDMTHNGGYEDSFVAKVKADGKELLYCGYIGGLNGDEAYGIAVDSSGNAYVTGYTLSTQTSFPVTGGPDTTFNGLWDTFVAKVSASGICLVYCGYIGGDNMDEGRGIAVDSSGNAYIVGVTCSNQATFPVTLGPSLTHSGNTDAFVAKVAYVAEMFADIALSKDVDNINPYVDDTVVFTVTTANLGPDVATGVKVADILPTGLVFIQASTSQGTYNQASGLWTAGDVRNRSSALLTLWAKVDKEGIITNTATTAGLNETDPNLLNNTASVNLTAEFRIYAPSNFHLQRLENDLIFYKEYINRLTWEANPLNKSNIVNYRLYRRAKNQPNTAFAFLKQFPSLGTSFDDRGLKKNELFAYRITAVNDKGRESDPVEVEN